MLTVGVGQAWFGAWKDYKKHFIKKGVKVVTLDLFNPGWMNRLKKVDSKIDFYIWHADTWEEHYRKIHDKIYFIENYLNKPVYPNMNQYYSYNDKIKQKELFDYFKIPQVKTLLAFDKKKRIMY